MSSTHFSPEIVARCHQRKLNQRPLQQLRLMVYVELNMRPFHQAPRDIRNLHQLRTQVSKTPNVKDPEI